MGFYDDLVDGHLASASAAATNSISVALPAGTPGDLLIAWVYYSSASGTPPAAVGWDDTDSSSGSDGTTFKRWLFQREREAGDTSITVTFDVNFTLASLTVFSLATRDVDTRGLTGSGDTYNSVTGEGVEEYEFLGPLGPTVLAGNVWDPTRGYLMFVEHTADSLTFDEPPMESLWGGATTGGNWDAVGWYGSEAEGSMLTVTANGFVPSTDFLAFWTLFTFELTGRRWWLGVAGCG